MYLRAWLLTATLSLGACAPHEMGDLRASVAEPTETEAVITQAEPQGESEAATARAALPGAFAAYDAPPPPPRPDFGDRPVAVADDVLARARTASLAAFEDKESAEAAGEPQGGAALVFTPARFEVAGAATPAGPTGAADDAARWRAAYETVETGCFPDRLRQALDRIGSHFGREVLVTSGRRTTGRSGSMHRTCMAADIRVPGVDPLEVARVARAIPGVNGVGTYRRVAVTHIDVREERWAWRW